MHPGLQTIAAGHATIPQEVLNALKEEEHGGEIAQVPQLVDHLQSSRRGRAQLHSTTPVSNSSTTLHNKGITVRLCNT